MAVLDIGDRVDVRPREARLVEHLDAALDFAALEQAAGQDEQRVGVIGFVAKDAHHLRHRLFRAVLHEEHPGQRDAQDRCGVASEPGAKRALSVVRPTGGAQRRGAIGEGARRLRQSLDELGQV